MVSDEVDILSRKELILKINLEDISEFINRKILQRKDCPALQQAVFCGLIKIRE